MAALPEDLIDRARPVRAGEELDAERLGAWLRERGVIQGETLEIEQFPRGFSNLTYLLSSGGQEMVLRRPPFGVASGTAHDMVREARILSALSESGGPVPRVLAVSDDDDLLGAPFYVMERVRGIILRDRVPAGLSLDAGAMRRLSTSLVDALVGIHALDWSSAGLDDLNRGDGYVARQVAGWSKRWDVARTGAQPGIESAAEWLAEHQPDDHAPTLVHNDFKYDNLVLSPDDLSVLAVLDWEMATIGDPLLDLGTSLAYWVDAGDPPALRALGIGITSLPGNLTRQEVVDQYQDRSGREVGDPLFYYVFGLFKVAVIVQQIHARFVRGATTDPRFAHLDVAVATLGAAAVRALDTGRIGEGV